MTMDPVREALGRGDPREVADMIEHGVTIHDRDGSGYTAVLDAGPRP